MVGRVRKRDWRQVLLAIVFVVVVLLSLSVVPTTNLSAITMLSQWNDGTNLAEEHRQGSFSAYQGDERAGVNATPDASHSNEGTIDTLLDPDRDTDITHNSTINTTTSNRSTLEYGATVSGALTASDNFSERRGGYHDTYSFTGQDGETISIEMRPESAVHSDDHAAQIFLSGPDGQFVETFGGGGIAHIDRYELQADGTYTVVVTTEETHHGGAYSDSREARRDTFDYQLRVYEGYGSRRAVAYGSTTGATLARGDNFQTDLIGYYDAYAVPGSKGDTISINMQPEDPEDHAAQIFLSGPDGQFVETFGGGGGAGIDQYELEATGTYTIVATAEDLRNGDVYADAQEARRDTFTYRLQVTGPENNPPLVVAAAPVEVGVGQRVVLNASETVDVNGDTVEYDWTQQRGLFDPDVTLTASETPTPSFVAPPVSDVRTLEFRVTATDESGSHNTASVEVTVDPSLDPANASDGA